MFEVVEYEVLAVFSAAWIRGCVPNLDVLVDDENRLHRTQGAVLRRSKLLSSLVAR